VKTFKLVASWIFVIVSVVLVGLLFTNSKILMDLLIIPALIAVFSTDDPSTPAIVPFLIFVGGYGLEIGWFVLLFFAVRTIVRSFKKEEQDKIPV